MATVIRKLAPYLQSNASLSSIIRKTLYNYFYKPYSQIITIRDIESCKENVLEKIEDGGTFQGSLPKRMHSENIPAENPTPEVSVYRFDNALTDISSSAFWVKDTLITYRTPGERLNEGFVKVHNSRNAKVIRKKMEYLDEGFFLGGNGSWNWFHYMVEIMPKLLLLNPKYTQTIFVHETAQDTPGMQTVLKILTEGQFTIRYLSPEKTYQVKKLYYINDFNHVQFNRFDGQIKAEGTFYHAEITRRFSDKILNHLPEKNGLPDKIFLYRKNTHRVAANQDQILEYLKDFDFVPICLEELSLEQQAGYFKNARFIIGISGAAWTNMLFCRNQPKALCFTPENSVSFSAFSSLGRIFEVDFYTQLYKNNGLHSDSNFIINFEEFKELFKYINGEQ
ncbi:MAG: glycosyltransferase family 61 protein [Chryseobacterium sp.]|uniref:glycosyltransferase family 61 protein n=1 Tax=Chryseobacterium sp. TaxID=1871047 RepID=UPI002817CE71|nr:glycosyltransferase family 61 protein [Chryseobacterium sp.]MDR2236283.1 glycosyltransferase family 61 protein [Chryseobacterium sp.]